MSLSNLAAAGSVGAVKDELGVVGRPELLVADGFAAGELPKKDMMLPCLTFFASAPPVWAPALRLRVDIVRREEAKKEGTDRGGFVVRTRRR